MTNSDLDRRKAFIREVQAIAAKHGLPFFVVTERAWACSNRGNDAVENARKAHIEWGRRNGYEFGTLSKES